MSPARAFVTVVTGSFPRVSGDEPSALGNLGNTLWFSPRERG